MDNTLWDLSGASWQSAQNVRRDFVSAKNPQQTPASVWCIRPLTDKPIVSAVIPTSDAFRGGYFPKLLRQLQSQTLCGIEVIVVRGDPRQGRAINIGVALARGHYLLTLDDDTDLPDRSTVEKLVSAMRESPHIGIAGANACIPDDASAFMRSAMHQIPRRAWTPVETITDSDLAQHPCMLMRTCDFKMIGGENELIPRGLDPLLRQRMREAGKRVVLVPNVNYYHRLPASLDTLMRQFFRNGRQSAWVSRHYAHWVIETPDGHGEFKPRRSFAARALRLPLRLISAFLTAKWIWMLCESAYAFGFASEWLLPSQGAKPSGAQPTGDT